MTKKRITVLMTFLTSIIVGVPAVHADCTPTTSMLWPEYTGEMSNIVAMRRDAVVVFIDRTSTPYQYKCSGTLIDSDLVLTARHCVVDWGSFKHYDVVFKHEIIKISNKYYYSNGTSYGISEKVEDGESAFFNDYAVIRLDGDAAAGLGITPTPIKAYIPNDGEPVVVMGHPRPQIGAGETERRTKRIAVGEVLGITEHTNSNRRSFRYSVNALGGMSGSGVLDQYGNLVAVHTDFPQSHVYPYDEQSCADGDGGNLIADVIHVSPVLQNYTMGITLRMDGNVVSSAAMQLYCGSDPTEQCFKQVYSASDFYEYEKVGCTVACPPGDSVFYRCWLLGNPSNRWLEEIKTKETTPNVVGQSYTTGSNIGRSCSEDICYEWQYSDQPVISKCSYTD